MRVGNAGRGGWQWIWRDGSNHWYIWKAEPIGFADGLNKGKEREREEDPTGLGLSKGVEK